MNHDIDISVIVVSYNTAMLIANTLDSVCKQKNIRYELIVIDNWSPDNSVEVLRGYQEKINLIVNSSNLGSGQAANQGFSLAKGKLLYLLNPDAVLQSEDTLLTICRYMEQHPQCGLAGTRVLEQDGTFDVLPRTRYPYQQHTNVNFTHLPGKIAWVLGASLVLRREVFELTKGFSKDYFLYGDEVDLCLRIRQQGYEIGYIPYAVVKHVGRSSEHNTRAYDYWIKKQKGIHTFIQTHYPVNDAKRIFKLEKKRAFWRLTFMKFYRLFSKFNPALTEKCERYRAVYDSSKQQLQR